MQAPQIPSDETARLQALASFDILDSDPEASFDAFVELAAGILGTPIALVSLVDAGRQWFKARYGLSVKETPRDVSFCGHVVADGHALVVPDARIEPRFCDNPLVTGEPHVRFYAGAPLRTTDGFVLGTLCTIDHEPRHPSAQQMRLLALLADQVVEQLEARRRQHELRAERQQMRESSLRLAVLFDAMDEAVMMVERTGKITLANAAAGRILGVSVDRILEYVPGGSGQIAYRFVHEDGSDFPIETRPAAIALRDGIAVRNVVMGMYGADDKLSWLSVNALPVRHEGEKDPYAIIATFHDITAMRSASERLSRQERLVTTGSLAAGVGHEVNNPLAYIINNLEFVTAELRAQPASDHTSELVTVLGEAREGAERIRDIVSGLRSLAREESEVVPIAIGPIVEIAKNMSAHEVRHRATVRVALGDTPRVLADESRLTQIFVNLLVNAGQAFLTADPSSNFIDITSAVEADGRVSFTVSDNGPGIPLSVAGRIFDPFFTTKPVGAGTGLGLSICVSIVTTLRGEIRLVPTARGAAFRVTLPSAVASEDAKRGSRTPPSAPRSRILIVDDEVALAKTMERFFKKAHDVVALTDPRDALALIRNGTQFDVVFCDLMMPYLRGDELYAHVRREHPALADRFVFVSGGATQPDLARFLQETPNTHIDKPFEMQTLVDLVRRFAEAP